MEETTTTGIVVTHANMQPMGDIAGTHTRHTWTQVAMAVLADITAQKRPPGSQLPGVRSKSVYGASPRTVRKAMAYLAGLGVVEARGISGYYVANPSTDTNVDFETRLAVLEQKMTAIMEALDKG